MHPEDFQWTLAELLLAEAVDASRVANWQRSGAKRKDYPKPIPRPGVKQADTRVYGKSRGMSAAEMDAWLGYGHTN